MILAVKSEDEILPTNRSHQVHGEEITAITFKRTDKHDRTRARENDLIAATIERRDLHAAGAAIFPMRPCGIERLCKLWLYKDGVAVLMLKQRFVVAALSRQDAPFRRPARRT
jgi:hypothetical protein